MDKLEIIATAYDDVNSCEYIKFNDNFDITFRKTIEGIKNASSIIKIKGGYAVAEENTENGKLYLLDDNLEIKECLETGVKGIVTLDYDKDKNIIYGGSYTDGKFFSLRNWKLKVYSSNNSLSKIHCVKYFDNHFYVVNCGEEAIYVYSDELKLNDKVELEKDVKPRHILIKEDVAYVICENSNEIHVFNVELGKLKFINKHKTYEGVKENYASTMIIKNNKMYALNRGADLIRVFDILDNKDLNFVREIPAYGNYPWEIKTLNDVFLVANEKSGEISIIDGNYNLITKVGKNSVNNILVL